MSKIEWCDETLNVSIGCSHVSEGCRFCYAERVAHRGMSPTHRGLTVVKSSGVTWTGDIRLVPEALSKPLRWKKPRRIFVNSMSDLFHEGIPFKYVAAVFGVMAACPQHTFIVLTKRTSRAREFFEWLDACVHERSRPGSLTRTKAWARDETRRYTIDEHAREHVEALRDLRWCGMMWPLPNVILGVSVEDQATADERIPILLDTPAAIRAVSYEPALGPVDFSPWLKWSCSSFGPWVNWVIAGGESGPGARPCALEWIRSAVETCRHAGTAAFVKQLGAVPVSTERVDHETGEWAWRAGLVDRKGGDPSEWPEGLRVRQWPEVRHA